MGISRTGKTANPKSEIRISNSETSSKPQISKEDKKRTMNCFDDWTFENSDLFGIWGLRFGISSLRGKSACGRRRSIYPFATHY
jgi:hypothetical protein